MKLASVSQDDKTRPWLKEKVYDPRITRTYNLVKKSVDTLRRKGERISLATIVAETKLHDEKGTGVAHTSILNNEQANDYYKKYRTSKTFKRRNQKSEVSSSDYSLHTVKLDRNIQRVKKRYMKMSKRELVDKLVRAEQSYAALHKDWLALNRQSFSELLKAQ